MRNQKSIFGYSVAQDMKRWFDIKVRGVMGDEPGDLKEITLLGWIVRWMDHGIEYEADLTPT